MRTHNYLLPLGLLIAVSSAACESAQQPATDPAKGEKLETVYIDLYGAHLHHLDNETVTVSGDVEGVRGRVEVVAKMEQGIIRSMTIATERGRGVAVPRQHFADLIYVDSESFSVRQGVTSIPRSFASVVVAIKAGAPQERKDLRCADGEAPQPNFITREISFGAAERAFKSRTYDACGTEIS